MGRSFRSELSQLSHQTEQPSFPVKHKVGSVGIFAGSYILGSMDSFLKGGGEISEFYANKFVCLDNVFGCDWDLNQWWIQDFYEAGAQTLRGGERQHMILPKFPKKCMKLKEFGPGGCVSLVPLLDPPLLTNQIATVHFIAGGP